MEMMRVLGVGIVGTLLAVTLARHNGGYGLLTGLATGVLLLMMLLGQTEELGVSLRELTGFGQLSSEYLSMILCAMLPAVREVLRSAETVLAEIGP